MNSIRFLTVFINQQLEIDVLKKSENCSPSQIDIV